MTEIILTSSVLILFLTLLRRALRGRINPSVQYALWLLVAARLLIPGTLFTAPVSVMGAAESLRGIQAETVTGDANAFIDPQRPDGPSAYFETQPAEDTPRPAPAYPDDGPAASFVTLPPEVHRTVNYIDLTWKTGIAVMGGVMIASNLVFYRRLRKNRRRLDIPQFPLPVYEAAELASPCLFGWFRPAVYLNSAALDSGHLDHILTHEYTHYRHGDHLWSILRSVCLAAHWFNPLVWRACALSRRDCELACDESAIRRLGEEQRIDYGQTLLQMVRSRPAPGDFLHTATTMTAGKRAMSERIALIAKQPKTRKITLFAVLLAVCVLVSCTFGGKGNTPPEDAISELLEFPGVQWNDSVETVMKKLNITEEQFLEVNEDSSDLPLYEFVIGDYPLLGETAQYVTFGFSQHTEDGRLGLSNVRAFYPDDMEDFASIREKLESLCGPGEEKTTTPAVNEVWKNVLGDRYDRWEELLQTPGVHIMAWELGADHVPEQYREKMQTLYDDTYEMLSDSDIPLTQTTLYNISEAPMAQISWDDRWLFGPTFNTVQFNGDYYVLLTQMLAKEAGAAAPEDPDGAAPMNEVLFRLNSLRDEEVIGYSAAGKDGAPANGGYSPAGTLPVLEEAFRACRWTKVAAPGDGQPVYWNRTSIGGFTFYDGSPLVSWSNGEETEWYSVPEGWLTVQAALEYAGDSERTLAEKKTLYLYEQARITWDMFQFDRFPIRYDGPVQEENGMAWLPVGFYESIEDMRGYLQTIFSPDIADFLMNMHQFTEGSGHLYVYGPTAPQPNGVQPNQYAAEETAPQVFSYTAEEAAQYGYDGHVDTQTPALDYDQKTVLWYKRHDYNYKWNGTHYVFTNFGPWDDVDPQIYHNAEDILRQFQQGAGPGQWIMLLDGMDWSAVAQAVKKNSPGSGDGSMEVAEILYAVEQYAKQQGGNLTAAEMRAVLTASDGLDGATAESYQTLVYQLYEANPALFAQIVLNELPQPQKNTVLDFFRFEWTYHQDAYKDFMDREGIVSILEGTLTAPESKTEWDSDSELSPEEVNIWQQALADFTQSLPPVPNQELAYDPEAENGLWDAVHSALTEFYRSYIAENGNQEHHDHLNGIAFDMPALASPGDQITVSYTVTCRSQREQNGAPYHYILAASDVMTTAFTLKTVE